MSSREHFGVADLSADEDGGGSEPETPRVQIVDAGGHISEGETAGTLWAHGLQEGDRRLRRRPLAALSTGLVGGFDVMIGVAVSATVSGSLATVMPSKLAPCSGR